MKKIQDRQVEPEHYHSREYDKKKRFIAYWHQINEIRALEPKRILEIGVGNGFVSSYLRRYGFDVVTLDFDKALKPDVSANLLALPFSTASFDVVVCYEVFEHIPFENFSSGLREIHRISSEHVVISLPDAERTFRIAQLPFLGEIERLIAVPRFIKPIHEFDGQHYWEIGKRGFPLNKILKTITNCGFAVVSTYRIFENPHHRFIMLKTVG